MTTILDNMKKTLSNEEYEKLKADVALIQSAIKAHEAEQLRAKNSATAELTSEFKRRAEEFRAEVVHRQISLFEEDLSDLYNLPHTRSSLFITVNEHCLVSARLTIHGGEGELAVSANFYDSPDLVDEASTAVVFKSLNELRTVVTAVNDKFKDFPAEVIPFTCEDYLSFRFSLVPPPTR